MIQQELNKLEKYGFNEEQTLAIRQAVINSAVGVLMDSKVREELEDILELDLSQ